MHSITSILAFASATLLVACAPGAPIGVRPVFIRAAEIDRTESNETKVSKNYEIGQRQQSYVGQTMVRTQRYKVHATTVGDSAVAMIPIQLKAGIFTWEFAQGEQFNLAGETTIDGRDYLLLRSTAPDRMMLGLFVDERGAAPREVVGYNFALNQPIKGSVFPASSAISFQPRSNTARSNMDLNFELVYSGSDRDSINLIYREYTDSNLARDAFTQNLTYDKSEPQIRFRTLLLEVHRADNQGIEFTVLEDGL